jgi:hypothetical protein
MHFPGCGNNERTPGAIVRPASPKSMVVARFHFLFEHGFGVYFALVVMQPMRMGSGLFKIGVAWIKWLST